MEKRNKTYILATASLSPLCNSKDIDDAVLKAYESQNGTTLETQRDLMKMVAILLSTGMNKNDDCFIKEEVLPVRNTGAHKPLNMGHKDTDIIGHMLRTYATHKDGTKIPDDCDKLPDSFDITTEAVIYKFVFPKIAEEIQEKAKANKLFVSVEVWFKDYDYSIGGNIVKRNEATASALDDVLRINGGDGLYKGHKVGRVLRDMLIGGIGVVDHPANPESVIKSISSLEKLDVSSIGDIITDNIIGKIPMHKTVSSDNSNNDEELEMGYKEITEEAKVVASFIKCKTENDLRSQAADIQTEKDAIKPFTEKEERENLGKLRDEVVYKSQVIEQNEEEIMILKAKVNGFEKEKVMASRKDILKAELGLNDEQAEAKLSNYEKLNDEEFVAFITDVKSYLPSVSEEASQKEAPAEAPAEEKAAKENKETVEVVDEIPAETEKPAEIVEDKQTTIEEGDKTEKVLDEIPTLDNDKPVDPPVDIKTTKPKELTIQEQMGNILNKYFDNSK